MPQTKISLKYIFYKTLLPNYKIISQVTTSSAKILFFAFSPKTFSRSAGEIPEPGLFTLNISEVKTRL